MAHGRDGLYLPDRRTATARIIEVACNAQTDTLMAFLPPWAA
jgi:hypothetical protein